MLYPIQTQTRTLMDLSGIWKFKVDDNFQDDPAKPLADAYRVAVPASYNDQIPDTELRQHAGFFNYQTRFTVPNTLADDRLILRFGSVTHEAWVYVNGEEVAYHKGGFTPFEADITDQVTDGENLLTVRVSNLLDYSTLPVGNYSETTDENGGIVRHVDENFDFFNYSGIHRPVKLYSVPVAHINDITIVPVVDLANQSADVKVTVQATGDYDSVRLTIFDEEGQEVANGEGAEAQLALDQVNLWQPLNAYLYTLEVALVKDGADLDVYYEDFGVRDIKVEKGQFLINGEPFYFKGFGKHEDTYVSGRGLNQPYNVLDVGLMKMMSANSIRTSHYPYSEEMMRLCDREGIVVIDEVPAVGLLDGFGFDALNLEDFQNDKTWSVMKTHEAHEQVLRELIARDKNHACVVMWSIANEAANYAPGAYEYFKPLFDLSKELDPQQRPNTYIAIMMSTPEHDLTTDLVDVICLNRYYGWYIGTGDLAKAETDTRSELQAWQEKYPEKPIMYTEYGADTVAGFHSVYGEPFSEEFQEDYYIMNSKVFDEINNFVGEQLWNFSDFQTKFGIQRVQGNKKGIFTREREPKSVVRYLTDRWKNIPNFGYKNR
ncbi:beta-glucuronidase [Suicoccus acidiformans]|uniref:Beta-glucuronidase n=1 Tax=Suicoccus acidiformans TaxID=2036206 RepID=A0A347WIG9_9LACT|nr:beta-glucuronidase [Suicoccus acidiformans]AXY24876.1 beta-glucuronidase [Suicoccus acidiformans]